MKEKGGGCYGGGGRGCFIDEVGGGCHRKSPAAAQELISSDKSNH